MVCSYTAIYQKLILGLITEKAVQLLVVGKRHTDGGCVTAQSGQISVTVIRNMDVRINFRWGHYAQETIRTAGFCPI